MHDGGLGRVPETPAHQVVPLGAEPLGARRHRPAEFVHARGILLGEDPEIIDDRSRRGKPVDADHLGHQGSRGLRSDPRDGFDLLVGSRRQGLRGLFQQVLQGAAGLLAALDRLDRLADQLLDHGSVEAGDGVPCCGLDHLGLLGSQVGDTLEGGQVSSGDSSWGGVLGEQPQHPGRPQTGGIQGQLGEDPGQAIVELIDQGRGELGLAL